jgi:hypothetical protein
MVIGIPALAGADRVNCSAWVASTRKIQISIGIAETVTPFMRRKQSEFQSKLSRKNGTDLPNRALQAKVQLVYAHADSCGIATPGIFLLRLVL